MKKKLIEHCIPNVFLVENSFFFTFWIVVFIKSNTKGNFKVHQFKKINLS